MLENDLPGWRKRNGYTQAKLAIALDVSRQTVSGWEQSSEPLPAIVSLALLALEYLPERCPVVTGDRLSAAEYRQARKKGRAVGRE